MIKLTLVFFVFFLLFCLTNQIQELHVTIATSITDQFIVNNHCFGIAYFSK
uniref:Uncharacterized protein n=1 Tax=Anguilla anguilla TaxID=7936 RepID=A0A0E9S869_ANGAN